MTQNEHFQNLIMNQLNVRQENRESIELIVAWLQEVRETFFANPVMKEFTTNLINAVIYARAAVLKMIINAGERK